MKRNIVAKFVKIPACEPAEDWDVTVSEGIVTFKGLCVTLVKPCTVQMARRLGKIVGVDIPNYVQFCRIWKKDFENGLYYESEAMMRVAVLGDWKLAYSSYCSYCLESKGQLSTLNGRPSCFVEA